MNQATPEKRTDLQNRWLGITFLTLVCVLLMSTWLLRQSTWKLALQLVVTLALLVMWIWAGFRDRFQNRFEMLTWTGILLATLSDILAFKACYYLFGAIALVGFIGWQIRRPTRKKPNDTTSNDDA